MAAKRILRRKKNSHQRVRSEMAEMEDKGRREKDIIDWGKEWLVKR